MQRRETGAAGDAPGHCQIAAADRLGDDRAARPEAEAGEPADEVVRERADEQPGGVGEEVAGGRVVESGALLEVADRELDLHVAAVIGLDLGERLCAVGDDWRLSVLAIFGSPPRPRLPVTDVSPPDLPERELLRCANLHEHVTRLPTGVHPKAALKLGEVTMAREWAHDTLYRSSQHRRRTLPYWLHH